MNRFDWIEYFEIIHGRSATEAEIAVAIENGEIVDVELEQSQTSHINVDRTVHQESIPQRQVSSTQLVQNKSFSQQQQALITDKSSVNLDRQEQVKQVSSVFWNWMLSVWKAPLSDVESNPLNSWLSFGLFSLLFTSTLFNLVRRFYSEYEFVVSALGFSNLVSLENFVTILFVVVLLLSAPIISGFFTRRFVYQETDFTLNRAMDQYDHLFAINIVVMAAAFLSSFVISLELDSFKILGFFVAITSFVFVGGTFYILANLQSYNAKYNKFYLYLISLVINIGVLYIMVRISSTFVENYFSILGEFGVKDIVGFLNGK